MAGWCSDMENVLEYDDIVVGSGISGMSMAAILARAGRKVLLLEKQPFIGGCMRRFVRGGIPFDTGFHFTGGFNGLLTDMLSALGIAAEIEPVSLNDAQSNHIILTKSNRTYDLPSGFEPLKQALYSYFPNEKPAIDAYFKTEIMIEAKTPFMNLKKLNSMELLDLMQHIDEDDVPLQQYLDSITADKNLQMVLSGFACCYGSSPRETSLATHCRVSYGMHESLARVKNGGDAFIEAFKRQAKCLNIEVRTGVTIASIGSWTRRNVNSVMLTDGSLCAMQNCIMAIHPHEILKFLPDGDVHTETFRQSVINYEESGSFFSLFAEITGEPPVALNLTSIISGDSLDSVISNVPGATAMAALVYPEEINGVKHNVLCAFETEPLAGTEHRQYSASRSADPEYQQFKQKRAEDMIRRIVEIYPQFSGRIKLISISSAFTLKDYLPPYGSAYGIMHKIGENGLLGRLPYRNFYAIGQNALLPGAVGAMLSAFIVGRFILGQNFLDKLTNP
jgi:phytoene dehydrogenase-like protein